MLVALLFLAGCDAVFGLTGAPAVDAAVDAVPDVPIDGLEASGCSDGEHEVLFADGIVGCAGGWSHPGLGAQPACAQNGDDVAANPTGMDCSFVDLCATGWHVCASSADAAIHLGTASCTLTNPPDLFFASMQSGKPGTVECAPGGTDDLYGCGSMGAPTIVDTCQPLTLSSGNVCTQLPVGGWQCGSNNQTEAVNAIKTEVRGGGALCCRSLAALPLTAW